MSRLSLKFRFIVAVFLYNTRHFHLNFMPQVQPATATTLRAGYKSNAYAPYTVHREPSHILFSFPSATIDVAQLNLIRLAGVVASSASAAVVAFSFAYSTTFLSLFSAVLAHSSLLGFLTFARPRHLHLFLPQRGGGLHAQLSPVRQTH